MSTRAHLTLSRIAACLAAFAASFTLFFPGLALAATASSDETAIGGYYAGADGEPGKGEFAAATFSNKNLNTNIGSFPWRMSVDSHCEINPADQLEGIIQMRHESFPGWVVSSSDVQLTWQF